MNATGSLRLKRGIWQMVFDYEDEAGQRRQKSESTGLPEKGNKRRAEAMLRERLAEYERQTQVELESKNMRFLAFMKTWLDTELPPKKKYHGAKAYTPAQTQEMLKVFKGDALETVVWLATAYGLRRSEVCGGRPWTLSRARSRSATRQW